MPGRLHKRWNRPGICFMFQPMISASKQPDKSEPSDKSNVSKITGNSVSTDNTD